ncbi:MAG TPA: hypothetical protein VGD29_08855 [Actinoplanes sp.]
MDPTTRANRTAWEIASRKHVREYDELLAEARVGGSLTPVEHALLDPLASGCADLVYTGKGALIWMPDIGAWALDAARLLRPGGHLFVFEGHPAVPLWTWDTDRPRIRPDRSYFAPSHLNDSFPANGAVERQWTLGRIVTAVADAGLRIRHLAEHPEPFWRMGGVTAAAWDGRLPNTFSLLASAPPSTGKD